MSETAYERGVRHGATGTGPAGGAATGGGGGPLGFLNRKMGFLPLWGWLALLLVFAVGYYFFKKNQTTTAQPATAAANQSTTNSSLIPQFVNQVYTNGSPPPAHKPHGGTETPPTTTPSNPVTVNIPNEGGWIPVTFPSAQALQQFYDFAGVTANNGYYPSNGDTNRAAWIAEFKKLGATGYPTV